MIQSIVNEILLDLRFPISFFVSQIECDHFLITEFREVRNKELVEGGRKGTRVISDAEFQVVVQSGCNRGAESVGGYSKRDISFLKSVVRCARLRS
jgi:hypothetical protein